MKNDSQYFLSLLDKSHDCKELLCKIIPPCSAGVCPPHKLCYVGIESRPRGSAPHPMTNFETPPEGLNRLSVGSSQRVDKIDSMVHCQMGIAFVKALNRVIPPPLVGVNDRARGHTAHDDFAQSTCRPVPNRLQKTSPCLAANSSKDPLLRKFTTAVSF